MFYIVGDGQRGLLLDAAGEVVEAIVARLRSFFYNGGVCAATGLEEGEARFWCGRI